MLCPLYFVGRCTEHANILVIPLQRTLESAREPQSPKGKGSRRVGHMIKKFSDTPFVARVPVQGLLA
jgi:hypothetical protein